MASKNLFKSAAFTPPAANTRNASGAPAYSMDAESELAQLAATGTFADTAYTSADSQLYRVLELAKQVRPEFVAKLAVYSRQSGKMKDMPSLLVAYLFGAGEDRLLKVVFPVVIDNGRMLRNFVQIVRSGRVGRKSLGTVGKKLVQSYFDSKSPESLFRDTVGNDPSLADVIKLAHPKPKDATRQALYRYIIGKELSMEQFEALPQLVKDFQMFKTLRGVADKNKSSALALKVGLSEAVVPKVPFQMLTALPLTADDWKQIARNGGWHFVRMNLNTLARHGALNDRELVKELAQKLRDPEEVQRARVLPYQLMIAYMNVDSSIPMELKLALQDALDAATKNVPAFDAPNGVLVFPDVSGSMTWAVTGARGTATTAARCVDVAALVSATVLRQNPGAVVTPFDTRVHPTTSLNPRDSVMTNAAALSRFGGGGTDCHRPLAEANQKGMKGDLVIYVSDNESWVDANASFGRGTATMDQWRVFKRRNPRAKMVCINLAPGGTTQASNDKDIMNIGGFSDSIFETIADFVASKSGTQWVDAINAIDL